MGLPSLLLTASVLASTLSLHICTKKLVKTLPLNIHNGHDDLRERRKQQSWSSISLSLAGFLFHKSSIDKKPNNADSLEIRTQGSDAVVDSSREKHDFQAILHYDSYTICLLDSFSSIFLQDSKYYETATIPFPKIKNIWERISYSWVSDLMRRGNQLDRKAPLEIKDLYKLSDSAQMSLAAERFEKLFATTSEGYPDAEANTSNLLMEFAKSPLSRAILAM